MVIVFKTRQKLVSASGRCISVPQPAVVRQNRGPRPLEIWLSLRDRARNRQVARAEEAGNLVGCSSSTDRSKSQVRDPGPTASQRARQPITASPDKA